MSNDAFFPASPEPLLAWILDGLERGEVLGIPRGLFFMPSPGDPFRMLRHGRLLETPIGVAAGPHTQLAQNIVAAWLCGARFIELKTVQVLDAIAVAKPCIDAGDEGYNCEWSQELSLAQSFRQYLTAHVLLHVLRDALEMPEPEQGLGPGFILDMSAGYTLEGFKSPGMQRFLDRMAHCPRELEEMVERMAPLYPRVEKLPIPAQVSASLTLSTMHGCPPLEIEGIASYLLEERGLDVAVKLNPTLLGPQRVRDIVNTRLGFDAVIPDEAFAHDLDYAQGVALIRSLTARAGRSGRTFGVKLTNTLETVNKDRALPPGEKTVYMSGRPLHPLGIALAAALRESLGPDLEISFCAGVDAFNVAPTVDSGLGPVTVCTDLLKPGGYGRLRQYVEALAAPRAPVGLQAYAAQVPEDPRYRKKAHPHPGVKTDRPLPRFDCAAAPCLTGCGAGQDIPGYLAFAARGAWDQCRQTILAANPFPRLLGQACDRLCQPCCTRINYDAPVLIRAVKAFAATHSDAVLTPAAALAKGQPAGHAVSVIGAGVEGYSCACFLALAGLAVTVLPTGDEPGKLLAIPAASHDIAAIRALGVRVVPGGYGEDPDVPAIVTNPLHAGPGGLARAVGRGRQAALEYLAIFASDARLPDAPAREDASSGSGPGRSLDPAALAVVKARRDFGPGRAASEALARAEAGRCLACDLVCNVCVTVCPNRANLAVAPFKGSKAQGGWYPVQRASLSGGVAAVETVGRLMAAQHYQVFNIADFCNACGNCATFCPSSGAPYRDKPRLHLNPESFEAAGQGLHFSQPGVLQAALHGQRLTVTRAGGRLTARCEAYRAELDSMTLEALRVELAPGVTQADLGPAAEAGLCFRLLAELPLVWGPH